MKKKELRNQIGRLFVTGWDTPEPSRDFLKFVSEVEIGGVILFEENCPGVVQIKNSIDRISSRLVHKPLVAIDQEGGRVCRIKGAPAEYTSAWEVGRSKDLEKYIQEFSRSAMYMESLGINLVLGPVADIFLDQQNRCLKDRCFGEDAGTVALFVAQGVGLINDAGLLSCLKHFPGLGAAAIDPHEETAVADYGYTEWAARERIPFEDGLARGADMVMTTHLRLPQIDSELVTASRKIITELLREQLEFEGPVITDDLTMKGAAELGDYGERAVKAFEAGHDLLLFGRHWPAAREAHAALTRKFDAGEITPERLRLSLDRIASVGYKLGQPSVTPNGPR